MIQLSILAFSTVLNFLFIQMNHPLGVGMVLLIQTLMICLFIGSLMNNFWFSYILFLVFLGGMLILFIYVVSLASNEMFSFSMKIMVFSLLAFLMMMILMYFLDKSYFMFFINLETDNLSNWIYLSENSMSLNKLYNFPSNFINIMLMIYLLITLIAIVKITQANEGPLRSNN